jgi:hypothetical protein
MKSHKRYRLGGSLILCRLFMVASKPSSCARGHLLYVSRFRIRLASIFHRPATLRANANNPQQVLGHLETVLCRHRVLNCFQLGRKELDNPATLRTDHVVVVLMLVIMFVVRDAIAKTNLASESGFRQKLQRAIDRSLSDAGVLLPNQAIKVFTGKVGFRSQKYVENQVALRRPLESLLLNMFKENFLLFCHALGDPQSRLVTCLSTYSVRLILHSETITVKTGDRAEANLSESLELIAMRKLVFVPIILGSTVESMAGRYRFRF